MTNVFEVCQWLVLKRPDILTVANQMYDAMNVSLDLDTCTAASAVIPQPAVMSNDNNEDKVFSSLFINYIKYLLNFWTFINFIGTCTPLA
jgi:hypothetical protein